MSAIINGDEETVIKLINEEVDVNAEDFDGHSVLSHTKSKKIMKKTKIIFIAMLIVLTSIAAFPQDPVNK